MSNYPDNIRDFDNHPMSPFYEEPLKCCWNCEHPIQEGENHNEINREDRVDGGEAYLCDDCAEELADDEGIEFLD